jgi:chromosome segregation ATPase
MVKLGLLVPADAVSFQSPNLSSPAQGSIAASQVEDGALNDLRSPGPSSATAHSSHVDPPSMNRRTKRRRSSSFSGLTARVSDREIDTMRGKLVKCERELILASNSLAALERSSARELESLKERLGDATEELEDERRRRTEEETGWERRVEEATQKCVDAEQALARCQEDSHKHESELNRVRALLEEREAHVGEMRAQMEALVAEAASLRASADDARLLAVKLDQASTDLSDVRSKLEGATATVQRLERELADALRQNEEHSRSEFTRALVLVTRLREERDEALGSLEFLRVQTRITQDTTNQRLAELEQANAANYAELRAQADATKGECVRIVSELDLAKTALAAAEAESSRLRHTLAETEARKMEAETCTAESDSRRAQLSLALQAAEKDLEEMGGKLASARSESDFAKVRARVWIRKKKFLF